MLTILLAALALQASPPGTATRPDPAPAATSAPAAAAAASAEVPLFASNETLAISLRADLRTLFRDRDSTRRRVHDATLTVEDADGAKVVPLRLRTRGHYRRQFSVCATPPIQMRFRGRAARGTPFEGQRNLKLVVQCRDRGEYEQFLLREYYTYRTYALLTDRSFRARLLRVTWEDAAGRSQPRTQYAFVIESEADLASRLGAVVLRQQGATDNDLEPHATALLDVFQYLVGNTDWSIRGLHNIVLFWYRDARPAFAIPYDFDWTGVVEARYASPDERLPITSVRQRLYRGKCRSVDELEPVLQIFRDRKEDIYAIWREAEGLDDRSRQRTLQYFDDFYRTIDNRGVLRRELGVDCRR